VTRPRYETDGDRQRETACAGRFAHATGCTMQKLEGDHARMDWFAEWPNGKNAYVEIKCRKVRYGKYPTLLIDAGKWREGVELSRATGALFVVLVAYEDGDYAYWYRAEHPDNALVRLIFGGRTRQYRGPGDVGPMMHIAACLFWKVA
jgi:hypothetical protein